MAARRKKKKKQVLSAEDLQWLRAARGEGPPPSSSALAVREPPPLAVDPSGAYVRLPLPPEILSAFGEYVEHGQRLFGILTGANASAEEFADACKRAAVTVARDVGRIQRARARRRR